MLKTRTANIIFIIVIGFFIASFTIPPAPFQDGKWKVLGITTVKGRLDKDEVKVKLIQGQLNSIKLKVKVAPLEMKKVVVHFRNGQKQNVIIRKNFPRGSESRAINLKGDKRFIKKVVFWYNKKKSTSKDPIVVLLGKQ